MEFMKTVKKSNNKVSKRYIIEILKKTLFKFFMDKRTERSIRTTICLIPACLFTYYKYINTTFEYSCMLLYVLMSSLIPPMIYGISIAVMMAFPAGVIGVSLVSLSWLLGTYNSVFGQKWNMFLTYVPALIVISSWKIGKAASLTGMASTMAIYSSFLPFFIGFDLILKGIRLAFSYDQIIELCQKNQILKQTLCKPVDFINHYKVNKVVNKAISLAPNLASIDKIKEPSLFSEKFIIPKEITIISESFAPLVGQEATLTYYNKDIYIDLKTGPWFISFAWSSTGKMAIIRGILSYGSVALGLFILSLIIPPQRTIKSYFRDKMSTFVNKLKIIFPFIINDNEIYTDKKIEAVVLDMSALKKNTGFLVKNMYEDNEEEKNDVDNTKVNTNLNFMLNEEVKIDTKITGDDIIDHGIEKNKFYNINVDSIEKNRHDSVKSTLETTNNNIDKFRRNEFQMLSNDVEGIYELLGKEVINIEESKQMVIVSAMEPSVSNPGPLVFYQFKWLKVVDSIKKILISYKTFLNVTRIKKFQDDIRLCISSVYPDENKEINLDTTFEYFCRKYSADIKKIVVIVVNIYTLLIIMISLRPTSEGSQKIVMKYMIDELDILIKLLNKEEKIFREHVSTFTIVSTEIKSPIEYYDTVLKYISFVEFHSILTINIADLAESVKQLLEEEGEIKFPKGLLLNLGSFCIPLIAIFGVSLKTIFSFILPINWNWKLNKINGKPRYVTSHAPWYNNTDIIFCGKWSLGILIVLGLPVFWDNYRLWYITNEKVDNITSNLTYSLPSKLATWTALGYLTTICATVEGTIHRAVLRLTGVLIGTTSAYVCLKIFGKNNIPMHILWILLTIFIACWIAGNPVSPILGYNPSWGYAAQLFTYQQCIIMVETFYNIETDNELVLSRLLAQLIGISIAITISLLIFPNCATLTIRQNSIQGLSCVRNSIIAFIESRIVTPFDKTISNPHPSENKHLRETKLSNILSKIKMFKHKKGEKNVKEVLLKRSQNYSSDVKDALSKIASTVKDCSILEELEYCKGSDEWIESVKGLQTLIYHLESMQNILPLDDIQNIPPISYENTRHALNLFNTYCFDIENILLSDVRYLHPGYSLFSFFNMLTCFKFSRNYLKQIKIKKKIEIETYLEEKKIDIVKILDLLTVNFSYNEDNCADNPSFHNDENEAINTRVLRIASISKNSVFFLSMSVFILTFIEDLQNYINIIIANY